jgi:hypothetical protein
MSGRKKRLRRGIESIKEQIEAHERKLEDARRQGKIGLEEYYEKEIESMKLAMAKKHRTLEK